MSNMLSLSRDSLPADEYVYWVSSVHMCGVRVYVCGWMCVASPPTKGPFLPNQGPPVRPLPHYLCTERPFCQGGFCSSQQAFCPPLGLYGAVLCKIIHLIMG